MKRIFLYTFLFSFSMFAMTACGESAEAGEGEKTEDNKTTGPDETKTETTVTSFEKGGLKVYSMENSPQFADATLELASPMQGADLSEGLNNFQFEVSNYELGTQTSDAAGKGIANSGKGQHIHFILNNGPYDAYYEPTFDKELEEGTYVLLAFLSRSYHESVKAPGAYVLRQFVVGQPANFKEVDLSGPHMFYSRPKGTYKGPGEISKLMLDFFLVNCDLSPEGYKVRAMINGNEFMLTKWVPYLIEGLQPGIVDIKLELLDAEGNLVNSPFNPVSRTVTLEAE